MAHLIPQDCYLEDRPYSERTVFQKIQENVSDEWYVFHSFNFLAKDPNQKRLDGEADFVMYHPQLGILVLEVKGGAISYHNGQWYQENRPISPVSQAKRNKYAIQEILKCDLSCEELPITMAHAVCFPSCQGGKVWPPEARGIVITQDGLNVIEGIVRQILAYSRPAASEGTPMPSAEQVLASLTPKFEYGGRLCNRIAAETKQFFYLTDQQCQIMEALSMFRRLHVCGGAGTGKTMLAIRKAQLLGRSNRQVLLLCFNELLAKRYRHYLGTQKGLQAMAVYDFCVKLMGIPQEEYNRHSTKSALYTDVLPKLLEEYVTKNNIRYDAVIVDEAQDFAQELWSPISRLVREDGYFYLFYDPDQNIFHDELHLPDFGMPPVFLVKNCRNTRRIWKAICPYQTIPSGIMEAAPEGAEVMERNESGAAVVQQELSRLICKEGVPCNAIVVLGAHSLCHTSLHGADVSPYHIVEGEVPPGDSLGVSYFTYMKFKGCEAKVVILLDVSSDDWRWNDSGLYTAMSRAVHQLVILRK